jgi:hypothetical protein
MPYDREVGDPSTPDCSCCGRERILWPLLQGSRRLMVWCKRCDRQPLGLAMANGRSTDG